MPVSRRELFAAGAAGLASVVTGRAGAQAPQPQKPVEARAPAAYTFFSAGEAQFIEPAVDRLIPPDDKWPGALQAGVAAYIDSQLAGAFGAGTRLYLQGPWKAGTPRQGYQLPLTPAQLYRQALADIAEAVPKANGGRAFHQLAPEDQDKVLAALEEGSMALRQVPSPLFFETLLANTIEGFFADPIYGGNRDMVGWRMVGFPGAYASYADFVGRHGVLFDREPVGIAGHVPDHR